jgi:hypothetical protein
MAEQLMSLSGCSMEEAVELLKKTNGDVLEALMVKMEVPPPKQKVMDEHQKFFTEVRHQMTTLTESISKGFSSSNQSESLEHSVTQTRPEEKVPQNNCSDKCLPPSPVSAAQKPETACQSLSECFCDSQSNDQKSLCFGLGCLRLSPSPKTE